MKVFVTGYSGQLGYDVANELKNRNVDYLGISSKDLDITDETAVKEKILSYKPDVIVHCAAWTNVDGAEENVEACRKVNVDGTRNIAKACKMIDATLVYISTDYVFNGLGQKPWEPDCKSYDPLNVYGQSKLDGELLIAETLEKFFIVRIAWAFGVNGKNFIKTMLNVGKSHNEVRVVDDQIGTPTYTYDLAKLICDMIETDKYGYYHATNEGGYISWYEFCKKIYELAGLQTRVIPVSSAEYGVSVAKRPFNSRLDKSKLVKNGFTPLPDWRDALSRYLIEIGEKSEPD